MGINDVVIGNSKYYRFNTYSMIAWLALIVLTNWWLLPIMGISGAALASLLSVLAVNLVRVVFIYYRFGFQPFGKNHMIIFSISLIVYLLSLLLPVFDNYLLDILVRGSLITLLFVPAIYFSATAPEINRLIESYLAVIWKKK